MSDTNNRRGPCGCATNEASPIPAQPKTSPHRGPELKPSPPEISDTASFLAYLDKIRERTMRVVQCIPPERLEWTFTDGRFTLGDLVRHIATVERYVFAEGIQGKAGKYPGCGRELADGYENVIAFVSRLHTESVEIISRLTKDDLNAKGLTGDGVPITVWKLLRVLVEHEVHHRGQIYSYLGMLGISTPPVFSVTSEQLRARGNSPD